jgi:hypothetical protein
MPAVREPEVAGVDSGLVLDQELQFTHRRCAIDGVDRDRSLWLASYASLWKYDDLQLEDIWRWRRWP